jgi:SAM-dependent methyltransferase
MKIASCYYCGSGQNVFYGQENGFTLVKCSGCGLLFLKDRPDDTDISQAHKQGRHSGNKKFDVTGAFSPGSIPHYLDILDDIFKGDMAKQQTWLDVGCGHGEFMQAVLNYSAGGVTVTGTDPNSGKQQSARQRGLNVEFFDLETHEKTYDMISLLNVYSHLPDPEAFLLSLKNLLKPGGELLLETGDTADLSAQDHYRPFYLPDHLSFASESIVVGILERLGFEIISINKYPFERFRLEIFIRESIKFFLPGYQSRLRYYWKWRLYSRTDMFIRAKIKN